LGLGLSQHKKEFGGGISKVSESGEDEENQKFQVGRVSRLGKTTIGRTRLRPP
jgi:hypothetical protein